VCSNTLFPLFKVDRTGNLQVHLNCTLSSKLKGENRKTKKEKKEEQKRKGN
jgi:hypothetical protein